MGHGNLINLVTHVAFDVANCSNELHWCKAYTTESKSFKDFNKRFVVKNKKSDLQEFLSVQVNSNQESKEGWILLTFFVVKLELKCKRNQSKRLSN